MTDLNSLMIFAKVVEAKSFSEAARLFKMPTSTVSRRVAHLEDELGVRLLERSTRSQSFTYDQVNRIATAETVVTSGSHCWGEKFGYDQWANLLSIGAASSSYNGCTQENLSLSVNASNQISSPSGYVYDLAGNLTTVPAPGSASYTYNAENQVTLAQGVTYTYDGDGKRVQKSSGKLYWYGVGSDPIAESDLSGNITDEYVFFGGKRVARRDSSGNVVYYFADHLGTSRIVTNATGTILDDSDFYPFGGERVITSSSGNTYKFTSKERDPESGLDNFGARYNSSSMGRFMSPDPIHVMKQRLVDPQQWNMYAYVRNNPLRFVDPTGMYVVNCKGLRKCEVAADDFERNRQKDLNSKDKKVRDAAAAWGNRGEDNAIKVTFETAAQLQAENHGNATNGSVQVEKAADGQIHINATFSESLSGKDLQRTIAHEGSHIEDEVRFLTSFDFGSGKFKAAFNMFHYDSEFQAFETGATVKPYANLQCGGQTCSFGPGPKGYASLDRLLTTNPSYASTSDQLLFDPAAYPQQ